MRMDRSPCLLDRVGAGQVRTRSLAANTTAVHNGFPGAGYHSSNSRLDSSTGCSTATDPPWSRSASLARGGVGVG